MCTMWINNVEPSTFVDDIFHSLFGYIPIWNTHARFEIIKNVRDNDLLTPYVKNQIFDIFALYQRNLVILNNISRRIKYSKMKCGGEDCDLVGKKFNEIAHYLKISIPHEGLIYTFRISDLINIINKSLTYREDLFLIIQPIKNPYTNIPFTIANLFQIYTHIKRNTNITMPVLFHLFYTTTFDKHEFSNKYEAIALDHSIQNYIDEFDKSDLVKLSHNWIETFNQTHSQRTTCNKVIVDQNYSKTKLVNQLTPILKHYLISSHTLTSSVKYSAFTEACNLMRSFLAINKDFGVCSNSPNIKQIVFKPLSHINIFSFNKNNETHISVVEPFIKQHVIAFNYPIIKPFADNIFIIRNYVNIAVSNSRIGPHSEIPVFTRRRLSYNDELGANNMIDFINSIDRSQLPDDLNNTLNNISPDLHGMSHYPVDNNFVDNNDDDLVYEHESDSISYDSF